MDQPIVIENSVRWEEISAESIFVPARAGGARIGEFVVVVVVGGVVVVVFAIRISLQRNDDAAAVGHALIVVHAQTEF